jgi:hypothetical protein
VSAWRAKWPRRSAAAAVALGAAILAASGSDPAAPPHWSAAAPQPRSAGLSEAAARPVETARADPSAASVDDGLPCPKVRKRLWVEGEGWIVRRVASCL